MLYHHNHHPSLFYARYIYPRDAEERQNIEENVAQERGTTPGAGGRLGVLVLVFPV